LVLRIQQRINPYKDPENNKIEMMAIMAGIITLYSALIFVTEEEEVSYIYNFALLLLFIVNIVFVLHWIYLLL